MTEYPMLDDKLATLRNAIEGGVKADTMQAMKLMELVDAIGEQFKRELADASVADAPPSPECQAEHAAAVAGTVYRDALAHIIEYWNRDRNDDAMYDALEHMIDTAAQALEAAPSRAAEPVSVTDEVLRELYARARTQANLQDFIGGAHLYLASLARQRQWRGGDIAAGTFVMKDGRWTEVSKDTPGAVALFHQVGWPSVTPRDEKPSLGISEDIHWALASRNAQQEDPIKCNCMKCGKLPEDVLASPCKEGFCPMSPIVQKQPDACAYQNDAGQHLTAEEYDAIDWAFSRAYSHRMPDRHRATLDALLSASRDAASDSAEGGAA